MITLTVKVDLRHEDLILAKEEFDAHVKKEYEKGFRDVMRVSERERKSYCDRHQQREAALAGCVS